ncbi:MAG TPA: hypothetical protein VIB39_14275 [Candidatus Angelobacter sp.]|jgi:hypothetical protein
MKGFAALLLALLVSAVSLHAQETPRIELFGGYSFNRATFPFSVNLEPTVNPGNGHGNLHGWNVSATVNPTRWLGVVADFAGYYGSPTASGAVLLPPPCFECNQPVSATLHNLYTFTFGPQLSLRSNNSTYFAHALFGGARANEDVLPALFPARSSTSTSFATILEGGADVGFSRHFAIHLQPGYLMTHILDRRQNSFRLSTGIVFRFSH